jgi:hypothetical protein
METTFSSIDAPNHGQKPFSSSVFRCPIAVGSFFIFAKPANHSEQPVLGRIAEARKSVEEDHEEDHAVTVNVFLSFRKWPNNEKLCPIKDGLGKNPQEAVLTSETADFHFDRDVCDLAFVFATFELTSRGAILQGIENVFVCCCHDNEEEAKDGELIPFPSMIEGECLVPQCFLARVSSDVETSWSQIHADLNRRGEQQGELTKTFNHIPFAWESWEHLKFKLSDHFGITVQPLTNRFFLHRLTHDMKRTNLAVFDVMRFSEESQLVFLRSVLGSNICCGIRASRAKLSDKAPLQIPPGCAVNCVAAPGDDELNEDNDKFVRAPAGFPRWIRLDPQRKQCFVSPNSAPQVSL